MADNNHPPPARKRIAVTGCKNQEDRFRLLAKCPVVRMCKHEPAFSSADGLPEGTVAVVPPEVCIGCEICVKECRQNRTYMIDW